MRDSSPTYLNRNGLYDEVLSETSQAHMDPDVSRYRQPTSSAHLRELFQVVREMLALSVLPRRRVSETGWIVRQAPGLLVPGRGCVDLSRILP